VINSTSTSSCAVKRENSHLDLPGAHCPIRKAMGLTRLCSNYSSGCAYLDALPRLWRDKPPECLLVSASTRFRTTSRPFRLEHTVEWRSNDILRAARTQTHAALRNLSMYPGTERSICWFYAGTRDRGYGTRSQDIQP